MKNQGRVIAGFILVFVIVIFSVMNTSSVEVSFVVASFQWPLILVILGSAIIGALIVILTSSVTLVRRNKEVKNLTKEVDTYKETADERIKVAVEKKEHEVTQQFTAEIEKLQQEISNLKQNSFDSE